ncbi:MAG: preprotein translocase subunit YajC [Bacteroidota bacterium]
MQYLSFLLQDGAADPTAGPGYMQFVFLAGIIAVFYFFMIRPQQKRAKTEREFRESLEKGSKVITVGGIHGFIEQIDEQSVVVRVDNNTKLRINKTALQPVPTEESKGK